MKKKPLIIGLTALLLIAVIFALGSRGILTRSTSAPQADMASMEEGGYADAPAELAKPAEDSVADYSDGSEKIIREISYQIRSKTFDEDLVFFQTIAEHYGGRIETIDQGANYSGEQRFYHVTYRIPTEKLDAFMAELEKDRPIFHKYYNQYSVTDSYNQTEARLKTLQATEERYLALLEKAEKIEDIIAVEQALTNVQSEIEWLSMTKDRYDKDIDFTAVQVNLTEVLPSETLTGQSSFWAEIKDAFITGINVFFTCLKELILLILSLWPILILLAGGLTIYLLRRKRNKPTE